MPDPIFANPRLAQIYDALDPDRSDLDPYLAIVNEFGATSVVDVGCGTGTFASLLASDGLTVTAVDPAAASIEVARTKPRADAVAWVVGTADDLPALQADIATMTANVAQVFVADTNWLSTLKAIHRSLRPGGHLVFETRIPKQRAWERWTKTLSHSITPIDGVGDVESWVEVLDVDVPLVSFRWTYRFLADGSELTSDSTLRFRTEDELANTLTQAGFEVDEIRDAPDRPGQEWVIIARALNETSP